MEYVLVKTAVRGIYNRVPVDGHEDGYDHGNLRLCRCYLCTEQPPEQPPVQLVSSGRKKKTIKPGVPYKGENYTPNRAPKKAVTARKKVVAAPKGLLAKARGK